MHRIVRCLYATAVLGLVGCGQTPQPPAPSAKNTAEAKPARSADHAVLQTTARNFLTGLLNGDLSQAKRWLTPDAFAHVAIEPTLLTGVPTAEVDLEVSEVRVVSPTEAVVQCHLKPAGSDAREELLCLLKRNSGDWGVSGLAWEAEGEAEPRILQFEPTPRGEAPKGFVGPADSPSENSTGARTATAPNGGGTVR